MSSPNIRRASENEDSDFEIPDPAETTAQQIYELGQDLKRTASDFMHLPFRDVAAIVGGVPKGELWYVGGFSGDGKTAFFTSLTLALVAHGLKVYYLPTETPGRVIRGHLACKALGYDVGDFLSGAYLTWPDATLAAQRVRQESRKYGSELSTLNTAETQRVWIAESGFLTPHRIEAEYDIAAALGADVVVVDHGDHTEDTNYDTSAATQKQILSATQQHHMRSWVSTQFNLDAVKGNRTLRYMAPRESYVFMGNSKRQVCDGMLGIYRPLKITGLDLKKLDAFKDGSASVQAKEILEPNTMAVHCMKHRKYGAREGERALLHVHHGRVQDYDIGTLSSMSHGISTSSKSLL